MLQPGRHSAAANAARRRTCAGALLERSSTLLLVLSQLHSHLCVCYDSSLTLLPRGVLNGLQVLGNVIQLGFAEALRGAPTLALQADLILGVALSQHVAARRESDSTPSLRASAQGDGPA